MMIKIFLTCFLFILGSASETYTMSNSSDVKTLSSLLTILKSKLTKLVSIVAALKSTNTKAQTFKNTSIPAGNFTVLSLAIFLDAGGEEWEMQDIVKEKEFSFPSSLPALAYTVDQALTQKVSILTSLSIFRGLSLMSPTAPENPIQKIFNDKKWSLYLVEENTQEYYKDSYCLLLYNQQAQLETLGFNPKSLVKITNQQDFIEKLTAILQRKVNIEVFKSIFLPKKQPHKLLYLSGHGGYKETISKLPIKEYQELLKFFESIGCMFLLVDTCQTGGANVVLGHQQLKTGLEEEKNENNELYDISYPIAIQGFTDVSVIASEYYDFKSFFSALQTFYYEKQGEKIAYWHKEPFKEILSHVSGKAFVNTQQIKFPHFRGFFEILDADKFVTAITYPRLLAHELGDAKTEFPAQPEKISQLEKLQELSIQKHYLEQTKITEENKKKISALDKQIEQLKPQIAGGEERKTKATTPLEIASEELYAILLYPSIITIPLHITKTGYLSRKRTDKHTGGTYLDDFPVLESMVPGNAHHYLHEIQLIDTNWKESDNKYYCVVCLFGKISKRASHKLFFIKSLTLPSKNVYKDSLIHTYPNETDNTFIIDWYLPNSNQLGTYSITRLSIPKQSAEWSFSIDINKNIEGVTIQTESISSSSEKFKNMLRETLPSKEALLQATGGRETEATFKKIIHKNYPEISKILKQIKTTTN